MLTSEVIERYNRYFKLRKNVEEIVLGLKNAPDYVDMITSSDRLIVEKLGTMAYELDDMSASRRWSVAKPEQVFTFLEMGTMAAATVLIVGAGVEFADVLHSRYDWDAICRKVGGLDQIRVDGDRVVEGTIPFETFIISV